MPPRRRKPPRAGALTDLPPLKITRSIILLQVSYYLIATILILFTTLVAGQQFSLALVLDWRTVRGDNTVGWMLGVAWLSVSILAYEWSTSFYLMLPAPNPLFRCSRVVVLLLLVSRSKLVPDFALTLHFLHLLATSLYTRRIPTHLLWWGLQAGSVAVMVSVGIWACRLRELRPISIGKAVAAADDDAGPEAGKLEGSQEDPSVNRHVRGGNGRGRNRDEGPSYEMLAIKEVNGEVA